MSSKSSKTRNRILESSLALLEQSEGRGVRMTDIASGAGISRQALYLHFSTRAELLIATTHFLDDLKGANERLQASRQAASGTERLDAYIDAWGDYIPEIYGIAKALLAMSDTDEEAKDAWAKRMQDMREGCQAAVELLASDKMLVRDHSIEQATDILWTLLSVRNWQQLTQECGWSQTRYIATMKIMARQMLVAR